MVEERLVEMDGFGGGTQVMGWTPGQVLAYGGK